MMKQVALIVSFVSLIMSGWALWRSGGTTTPEPVAEQTAPENFTIWVEKSLMEKPEIILNSIEGLQKKKAQKHTEEMKKEIAAHKKDIFENAADPVGGNLEGDITLVEFFDYRCGYCRKSYGFVHEAVAKDGNVKIIYKELPIFGGDAIMSKAALAAKRQGKYADFHKALMLSTGQMDAASLEKLAGKLKLDVAKFKKDMNGPEVQGELDQNMALAGKLNITGTPAFIIGDEIIPGAMGVEQFLEVFKGERAKKSS